MSPATLFVTVVLAAVAAVHGYGSGAPKDACETMIPKHRDTPPQTSPFPYVVSSNKKSIRAGEKVQIVISAGANAKDFMGFLVEARVGNVPVGKFSPATGAKLLDCENGKDNAITHSKADKKTKIALEWTAPPSLTEKVTVYATVAKNGGEFWVKKPTVVLNVKKQDSGR